MDLDNQFSDCVGEWKDLELEYHKLEEQHKHYSKQLAELYSLQSSCGALLNHQKKKYKELASSLRKHSDHVVEEEQRELDGILAKISERESHFLHDVEESLPKKNGIFLTVTLGSVNLSLLNKKERFNYKEEYENFKFAITIIMLVISFLNRVFMDYRFQDALFHFLLLWYYCTVTLREHILTLNGSRIKGWWLTHHYISCVLTGVLLIWPDGPMYDLFRNQFMTFSLYLSFVQVLQYYYQRGCLYRLKALGQRKEMDVTAEGFHSWMWKGLTFLLPFLFFGHFYQLYNAYTLYQLSLHEDCVEWQVPASALIFFILFFGNFTTLCLVVKQKIGGKKK